MIISNYMYFNILNIIFGTHLKFLLTQTNQPMRITTFCSTSMLRLFLLIFFSVPLLIGAQTTYTFTGSMETYTVPAGVTEIKIDAYGAQGANNGTSNGGNGGYISGILPVTPGETLNIFVGGQDGFNGGGAAGTGGTGTRNGLNGGGASDVRQGGTTLSDRIIVAGGGGGAGRGDCTAQHGGGGGYPGGLGGQSSGLPAFSGGDGTASSGGNGGEGGCAGNCSCSPGGGGGGGGDGGGGGGGYGPSQGGVIALGGTGGACGQDGDPAGGGAGSPGQGGCFGVGGNGGNSGNGGGGGGGAGWYGGGAGGGNWATGGGGGSSYILPVATDLVFTNDTQTGNGQIVITALNASPVITCPGNFNVSNDAGQCSAVVTYTVTATDAEDGTLTPIQTAGLPSGSAFPVGTTTNTFEVTDSDGSTATCSFDVIVEDNEAPQAICEATLIQNVAIISNNGFGNPLATSLTNNGYTVTYNGTTPPSAAILANTDVVFLIRTNGNTDLATWVQNGGVLITEWSASVWALNTANLINATDSGGGGVGSGTPVTFTSTSIGQTLGTGLPNPYADGGATEFFRNFTALGGSVEIHATRPGNIPAIIGDNAGLGYVLAISYDYQDIGGGLSGSNTEQLILNALTANYNTPLVFQLDADGMASITVADIDSGSTDNCGIESSSVSPNTFDCSNIGSNIVTLTVTDASGNTSTCTRTIIIEDNLAPVITCVPDATRDTDPGVCEYTVVGTEFDATFTDNCTTATITNDLNGTATLAGEVLPLGDTTVVWIVDDGNGQTATCTTVITIEDNENPTITCVGNQTVDTDAAVCTYTHSGTAWDATATDNCYATVAYELTGATTGTGTSLDGVVFNLGETTVTWTATDGSGNTDVCSFTVTVEDNENPAITCVANQTVDTDFNTCDYTHIGTSWDALASDNCSITSTTYELTGVTTGTGTTLDGVTFNFGTTTVTWTTTDGSGNTTVCSFTVTVEDNQAPQIVCPNDIVIDTEPGTCEATVFFAPASAFDSCDGFLATTQTAGPPSGSSFPIGETTISFSATDSNGNTATCSFTITVVDNQAPMAVCQNITIQLDADGLASITAEDLDGGSTDNCSGPLTFTASQTTFDCSDLGENTITLTVTDAEGNSSTCTAIVTVEDNIAPVAECVAPFTIQLDANGEASITAADIDAGSTDNCSIDSITLSQSTFTCADLGENEIILTVTDVAGNSTTCTTTVTVEDNISPIVTCIDFTLELGPDGTAFLTPEDIGGTSTDNCAITITAIDIEEFDCSDIGTPVLVTYFASDESGNIASCTAMVTVVDNLGPVIECPADQTVDTDPDSITYTVPDYFAEGLATATDNCTDPVTIFSQTPAPGTLLVDGVYTVTLTAEDEYGNESVCEFELTVDTILGVEDVPGMNSLTMYPNPAVNEVTIGNPQFIAIDKISVYDIQGRLVFSKNTNGDTGNQTINVSDLSSAVYMIIIESNGQSTGKRLIKK